MSSWRQHVTFFKLRVLVFCDERERGPICAKPYRHNIVIKFTSIVHTAENNTQITLELNLETTLIKIYTLSC